MRTLCVALLLLVSLPAVAAPVVVTWTNPVTFVDGTTLAPADIASTKVEYSAGTTFGTVAGSATASGSAATVTIDRPPGPWCFRAQTTVVASKGGGTSSFSSVACTNIAFPNPNAPTSVTVTVTVTLGP